MQTRLGVREVILLPSVRAGIHMAVLAGIRPGAVVIGPAYTCDTVHQALALSGAHTQLDRYISRLVPYVA